MDELDQLCDDNVEVPEDRKGAELQVLDFDVHAASYSCPGAAAASLGKTGGQSYWEAGAGDAWVVLRLREKSLLSFVRVHNRSCASADFSISLVGGNGNRARNFVPVKTGVPLPNEYCVDVPLGHLPCRYVRVGCRGRGGGGNSVAHGGARASLHSLQLVGLPAAGLAGRLGPAMAEVVCRAPQRLLFGSSWADSRPLESDSALLAELVLPFSRFRLTDDEIKGWEVLVRRTAEEVKADIAAAGVAMAARAAAR
ncbi:unnamed protein product [Phaeothamnion confervicola]